MPGVARLRAIRFFATLALLSFFSFEAHAQIRFDLPAQPLARSLTAVGALSSLNIYFDPPEVQGLQAPALKAELNPDDALARLLAGTRLRIIRVNENTLRVVEEPAPKRSAETTRAMTPDTPYTPTNVRLADASEAVHQGVESPRAYEGSDSSAGTGPRGNLEEVIVTAQKREERLLDVPIAMTALSGDELERTQARQLEDYVGKVPGLTLIDNGAAGSQLVIRGITNGSTAVNSSVATYIDDTPFTVEGPWANSALAAPNLDTFDMQRIEVLRGPQGTLYGANSLAGLLKYVTNAPDPTRFAAEVETGISTVEGGGTGFDVHSMVNLPLAPNMALRLVGYDNDYPGFIDDPSRGLTNINGTHFAGGRASLLYQPSGDFSIRLNALYQKKSWGDWPNEDVNAVSLTPLYGNLIQQHLIGQPGFATTEVYSAALNWDVGVARLLSVTSYYREKTEFTQDFSDEYGPDVFGAPYGLAVPTTFPVHALTQELRATSTLDMPLQWIVGGYFTTEGSNENSSYLPIDANTRAILYDDPLGLGGFIAPTHYREYAAFVNLDYRISSTVDAALGGRYSENKQTFHETAPGLFGGGYDFGLDSSESVFTYSADARWHFTPDNMLYARVATGFVPGGPNDAIPNATVPASYSSSKTINYEIGLKNSLLDQRLTSELSVFHIDWRDIQLTALVNGFGEITNGGRAQSDGVEWNLNYAPLRGLALNLNGAYTDARLTEATPASVNGLPGNRLPSSPLWQASASADYERTLKGNLSGFAGASWRFTGARFADFSATGPRQEMPSNNIVDLHLGLEARIWSVALFVKNVGNKLAINYVQPETLNGGAGAQSATVYMPRTVGATLTVKF
jgi:iron complex outermembrane recepter protein